jgi:hypothetical protein
VTRMLFGMGLLLELSESGEPAAGCAASHNPSLLYHINRCGARGSLQGKPAWRYSGAGYLAAIFLTVLTPRRVAFIPSVFSSTALEKLDSLCLLRHNQ